MASQTVSLNMGQGVDTKTDPKMVIPAKLTVLQNGIFTNALRVTKRPGYDSMSLDILTGGTITSPTMVKSYRNELVCAGTSASTGLRLFSYSEELEVWIDKGKYVSAKVSKDVLAAPGIPPASESGTIVTLGVINSSSALIDGIAAYAYDNDTTNHASPSAMSTFFSVVDTETGGHIADSGALISSYGTTQGFSKIVALGNSIFCLFYISKQSSTTKLCYQTLTVTNSGITLGSEVQVHVCASTVGYVYDVQTTSGGAVIALADGSDVYLYTINTSGTLVNGPTTISTSGNVSTMTIALDTTGTNAWIYWFENATTLKYAIYNASSLSSVLSATTISSSVPSPAVQISALATSSTTQTVYWSSQPEIASSSYTIGVYYPVTYYFQVTQAGSIGSRITFLNGLSIYSKPFSVGSYNYMAFVSLSQSNPVGVIIDLADGLPVAKFLAGFAEGVYSEGYNTAGATYESPTVLSVRWPGFLNTAMAYSSTDVGLACGYIVSSQISPLSSASNAAAFPSSLTTSVQMGVATISFDFDNIDAYQALIQQDTLVMNGGLLEQYDGSGVTELGFTIDPDAVSLKCTTSGGVLGAGTWTYYILYSWTDANGNFHQSAPSLGAVVNFTSGTTNKVAIGCALYNLTQKSNVVISIYRTISGGTIGYLLSSFVSTPGGWSEIFTDEVTDDATLLNNPQLYTEGGAVLDNIAAPPSVILWTNNNRVWCVDSENPETTIEYSKTASPGSGIAFSTGIGLDLIIDSRAGAITGVSPMDEKTIVLKQSGIGYFIGDGNNDSGSGSTITSFQYIPYDTGCVNSKSVVLFPDGIVFKSPKGIYSVSRGLQVYYFGPEVQAYNSQDVQSAILTGSRNQIRFLTSSGSSLLYDYVFKQWSIFTNHTGYSATLFNNLYTYVRTDGSIYIEDLTSYLDNTTPYALTAQTAWIKATATQNFERVKEFELLGDYSCGSNDVTYGFQLSFAYDFGSTFTPAKAVVLGTSGGSTIPFQERIFTPRQKCNAIQVLIQELPTGAANEYFDMSDLGMEIDSKRGLNKLPAQRSTG